MSKRPCSWIGNEKRTARPTVRPRLPRLIAGGKGSAPSSPKIVHRGIWSSTGTASSTVRSRRCSNTLAASWFERLNAVPGKNGVAERWVGSCRRELLDHVIVLNESHLRRLVGNYLDYYRDDRIHNALKKETPTLRAVEPRPEATAKVVGAARVGGLHHRYRWQTAA